MLLNHGELEGVRVLKPETVALLTRNHLPESLMPIRVANTAFARSGFGLGFAVVVEQKNAIASADDWGWNRGAPPADSYWWVGAYQTYFWIDPTHEIVGLLFAQSTEGLKYPFMQEFHALVYEALEKEEASN